MKHIIVLLVSFLFVPFLNLAHAETMKPGLWQFTVQMSGGGMPAMPKFSEAQRKQMESMGMKMPASSDGKNGGMNITTKSCVTAEQAKKGVPPSAGNEQQKCEQTDIKTSGKTTTWKMVCTGKYKGSGSGSVTYDSAEHFSGESIINMEAGPQGPMTMNNKFSGTFVSADCKQGK